MEKIKGKSNREDQGKESMKIKGTDRGKRPMERIKGNNQGKELTEKTTDRRNRSLERIKRKNQRRTRGKNQWKVSSLRIKGNK